VTYVRQGDIWVSQPGGSSVNLTNDAAADFYPSWSPDGTQIAFASRYREGTNVGYYVLPALGGRPRRILATSGLYPARPAWSADGRTLLASTWGATGSVQLEMVNLESMKSQMITVPGRESIRGDLSWSRDNRFIAFVDMTSPLPEVSRLWLTRLSDHEPVALTDGLSLVRTPAFSADARYVYYVSNRQGSSDLWLQQLGEDGSPIGDPQRLTSGIGMSSAALSYDDSKFAYSRGREVVANVWRVPLRDDVVRWADAQQLTFDEALIEFVDVTPDGRELVISSDRHGNQDIWRMPSAGGEMQPVTSEPSPDWRPSISADGQQLAFYAYRTGNREIWTMPLAGGPARQVTSHEAGDYHPTWSPDGSRIAFASNRRGQFSVWVVAATGGEPQLVVGNPGDNMPAWSPDGEWIAFVRIGPNGSRLFRVPAKGGAPEQITSVSSTGGPRWSRNGKWLYFMRPGAQIWEISVGTLMERQLADLSGRPGTVGQFGLAADGSWIYFTWQTADADLWTMDVVHE
jgi:Tol biopolymer transport system component